MKKKKLLPEPPRIYVIVPESVLVTTKERKATVTTRIPMEPGRLMAQVAHVARKMENEHLSCTPAEPRLLLRNENWHEGYREMTTIVLSVRNSRELAKVLKELGELVTVFTFSDVNPEFYGTKGRVMTAICTVPTTFAQVDPAIGHLDLYGIVR